MNNKKHPRVLIHICCAPCFIAPYLHLKEEYDVTGFWYNPNIQPYTEYMKRKKAVEQFCLEENIRLLQKDVYPLAEWIRKMVYREEHRCTECYYDRLWNTVLFAKRGKFDYFTSTLFYSKFQKHDLMREIGESLGRKQGVSLLYYDFREYWKEGIALSKERKMYRQQYCGCIYSERDRYYHE